MGSILLISAVGPERRVALIEDGVTTEIMRESAGHERLVGNIYKGRVVRVLPGMQSAFVEVGLDRAAFLYAGDLPRDDVDLGDDGTRKVAPIAERLTEGQDLMVQVAKEPLGTKGARITSQITLPGRFVVYMPTVDHIGVSRRIEDEGERERLRVLAERHAPARGGLIVRTAAEGCDEASLAEDLRFLSALWDDILDRSSKSKAPVLLHKDLDITLMATRDLLRPDFEALIVDSAIEYDRLVEFLDTFMPACRSLLALDDGDPPIFTRYGVEHDISRALERKVWLKSGGSIVIDQTEALTAIDVNTGRYVGKTNFEDTVLKINLEAVREIAYQLRLRNIGGIIVIDFIDMAHEKSQKGVYEALVTALEGDKVRTRVLPMSALGLVEMTRKRVRESLPRSLAEPCRRCDGRGWTLTAHEIARQVVARIRDTLSTKRDLLKRVDIEAQTTVAETVWSEYRDVLEGLERRFGVEIGVHARPNLDIERFEVKSQ